MHGVPQRSSVGGAGVIQAAGAIFGDWDGCCAVEARSQYAAQNARKTHHLAAAFAKRDGESHCVPEFAIGKR